MSHIRQVVHYNRDGSSVSWRELVTDAEEAEQRKEFARGRRGYLWRRLLPRLSVWPEDGIQYFEFTWWRLRIARQWRRPTYVFVEFSEPCYPPAYRLLFWLLQDGPHEPVRLGGVSLPEAE